MRRGGRPPHEIYRNTILLPPDCDMLHFDRSTMPGTQQARRTAAMTEIDYQRLADFRFSLRQFLDFSKAAAHGAGLTPQQHQMLLQIKGLSAAGGATVGGIAQRLMIRHHSAVEHVNRLVAQGLARRRADQQDHRRVQVLLTAKAEGILGALSATHLEQLRLLRPSAPGHPRWEEASPPRRSAGSAATARARRSARRNRRGNAPPDMSGCIAGMAAATTMAMGTSAQTTSAMRRRRTPVLNVAVPKSAIERRITQNTPSASAGTPRMAAGTSWKIETGKHVRTSMHERLQPREERVIAFDRHQADQHQQAQRRHQDRELQRQALPRHVHEDRDDEAGLQQHEER